MDAVIASRTYHDPSPAIAVPLSVDLIEPACKSASLAFNESVSGLIRSRRKKTHQ
jgi:hypothetical protein